MVTLSGRTFVVPLWIDIVHCAVDWQHNKQGAEAQQPSNLDSLSLGPDPLILRIRTLSSSTLNLKPLYTMEP
jgi:hypothetical protein